MDHVRTWFALTGCGLVCWYGVAGAEILVQAHAEPAGRTVVKVVTNEVGIAGFATPADVEAAHIVLSVHHPDYNARHVRLDGTNLCIDLRRELYG